MREQKYADVLKKYDEMNEDKLSMTREIKFKDLQESMDNENLNDDVIVSDKEDKSPKKAIVKDNNKDKESLLLIEEEVDKIRENEEKKRKELKVKEAFDDKENIDDDIYLTTSFKPLKKRISLKKIVKKVIFLMVFIVILGLFSYFVVLPFYKNYINSRPKIIFDKTVEFLGDKMVGIVDELNIGNDSIYADFNLDIASKQDSIDFKYGYSLLLDSDLYERYLYLKKDDNNYGIQNVYNNDKSYIKLSNGSKYFEVENDNVDEIYKKYSVYLNKLFEFSSDDYKYLIDREKDIIKKMLISEYIKSDKTEIEVRGKQLNVVRNSFTIDKDNVKRVEKIYYDEVLKDDKLVKILASLNNLTTEKYKEKLGKILDAEVEKDYKIVFNIYTIDGTKVVGFDIEENGFCLFYLYLDGEDFDFYINLARGSNCLDEKDCKIGTQKIINIKSTKDEYRKVNIKYNDKDFADFEIKSISKDNIELSYLFKVKRKEYSGNFVLNKDQSKDNYDVDFSIEYDDYKYNFNSLIDLHAKNKLENLDKDDVVKYNLRLYSSEYNELIDLLYEMGMKDGFLFWKDTIDKVFDELNKTQKQANNG